MALEATQERRLLEILERGGVSIAPDREIADPLPKYNGLADPLGAEELATELAARVDGTPTVVIVWEDVEDIVLGYVVAKSLGLPVVRTYNADGLIDHGEGLGSGAAVLLVTDAVRDPQVVQAVRALAERYGGTMVHTAVLVETAALREVAGDSGRVITLIQSMRD